MRVLLVFLSVLLLAPTAFAAEILSAREAAQKAAADEILLVDIRRPQEWAQSGVAEPAQTISMHRPGFLQKLDAALAANPGKPLALICATGGRTAYVARELEKRGYANIIDVSEGMMGNQRGTGWLAQSLPIRNPG